MSAIGPIRLLPRFWNDSDQKSKGDARSIQRRRQRRRVEGGGGSGTRDVARDAAPAPAPAPSHGRPGQPEGPPLPPSPHLGETGQKKGQEKGERWRRAGGGRVGGLVVVGDAAVAFVVSCGCRAGTGARVDSGATAATAQPRDTVAAGPGREGKGGPLSGEVLQTGEAEGPMSSRRARGGGTPFLFARPRGGKRASRGPGGH